MYGKGTGEVNAKRGAILVGSTAHRRKRRGFRDGPARWVPWIRAFSGQCRARSGRSRVPHAGRGFLRAHGRVFGPCRLALAEMRAAAHRRHPVRSLAPPPRFLGRSRSRRMRGRPAERQAVDARSVCHDGKRSREGDCRRTRACLPARRGVRVGGAVSLDGGLGGFPGMRQLRFGCGIVSVRALSGGLGAQGAHVHRRCPVHVRGGDGIGALAGRVSHFGRHGVRFHGRVGDGDAALRLQAAWRGRVRERRRFQRPQHQGEGQQPYAAAHRLHVRGGLPRSPLDVSARDGDGGGRVGRGRGGHPLAHAAAT